MKIKLLKYSVVLFAISVLITGCTKKFDKINTNPASYSQSTFDPNYLLTSAQLTYTGSTDFSYETWRGNLIYSSTMMQGLSTVIGYWAGDKYLLNEGYTAAYWTVAYPEQVKPVVDLVQFTKEKPQYKNLYQISRIMRALIMERITDLYGDVPYTGAGQGYYTNNFFPKYDKQQDIYADLLKEVEDATNNLDAAADKPAGDVFYNGNIDQWKKFGNTLLLRIAMRLTKIDPATAQAYVTKVQGKTFTGNADNAFVKHDATGGRTTINRNSQVLLGDGGQEHYYVKWSQTFIDFLKSTNDPRLGKVAVTQLYLSDASKNQNGTGNSDAAVQKGMPNGKDLSGIPGRTIGSDPSFTSFPDYSSASSFMIKRDGPTFILTYAEAELLLADAAQRWNIGGSPATHYNNGVKAAMTYLGQYDPAIAVSDAAADAFLLANPYVAANGLEMINTQYWAHAITMLDFYETWSNWRRTGFPLLTPVVYPNNATGGTIPRRFPYPSTEASSNPDNYKAAHDAVSGGDVLTSRVWWDK
ncbi:MAG: SusD/RagB family nutrient-binding outer membrane lipoprotein [Ferruginibacter sp.]